MDANLQARIREIVDKNDKIAIAVGKTPSLDDMAAGLALYLGLTQLSKKVSIASPSQPLVAHSSLVGIDRVKSQFEGDSGDLIVSFPYREGEIEKVSYTIENGYLNIVVKAGEQGLQFREQEVRYSRGGGAPQVLFIVGTPRLADLGSLFNPEALKDTTIVNIDNKPENQGFGDLILVSQTASSVSEIVSQMLSDLGVDIDIDIAQNLLNGINEATENFQNPKTTPVAFALVGDFMKKGARRIVPAAEQNEERVSSLMPEQMFSQPMAGQRSPMRNPFLNQMPAATPMSQPPMSQAQQPYPRMPQQPYPRPQVRPQPRPMQQPGMTSGGQQMPPMPQMPPIPQQTQQNQAGIQQYPQQPQQQVQSQQSQQQKPPSDWLTPKVYKGSSNV